MFIKIWFGKTMLPNLVVFDKTLMLMLYLRMGVESSLCQTITSDSEAQLIKISGKNGFQAMQLTGVVCPW